MMWRWLCATGVYHAAANTLSVEIMRDIGRSEKTVEEFLCKHQNVWSENDRYFDRCAAGLGMSDAEHRLAKVMSGDCKLRSANSAPADWETYQMRQFGDTMQLSCNPASTQTGFTVAMGACPEAFRLHFPCIPGALDYRICSGEFFGMDVKKDGVIVPYHRLCGGHDMLRRVFECTNPGPFKQGTNMQLYALEWTADHGREPKPWNVIDWFMGTNVGVWGGWCTCPDGRVYQVGDEGNMCGSVACDGGFHGTCAGGETEGAFRKIICAPPKQNPPTKARNQVIQRDATVGVWGGECTCPDGSVYLAGISLPWHRLVHAPSCLTIVHFACWQAMRRTSAVVWPAREAYLAPATTTCRFGTEFGSFVTRAYLSQARHHLNRTRHLARLVRRRRRQYHHHHYHRLFHLPHPHHRHHPLLRGHHLHRQLARHRRLTRPHLACRRLYPLGTQRVAQEASVAGQA